MTLSQNNDSLPTAARRGTQGAPSLADFVSGTWLPHIRASKASWKLEENTAKNHILPMFGQKRLDAITEADVRRWLAGFERQNSAPATRNRRFHVLKGIFDLAVERGVLAAAPTRQIRCARVAKTRWPSLDREHLSFLLEVLNRSERREARALALLLLTGARKNEILTARWENLFLEENLLLASRPGTASWRKIWLSPEAREIFRSIPRQVDSPWIFPGRDKAKPISDIFLFWKEVRAELGLEDLTIRDLRYVFADWQLRSGMSMPTLQRCMGITDMRELHARLLCSGTGHGPLPA
ncbi:tyrosine-type recombinase/integrase [uncultured Desulfovibrio sp.]|uniref:tyrosine-type recombinase/integrase n=1 Tax=uncultured Desulfovibrio sp. TaxID=167968 RepID=UPI0025EEC607|nr:tyrosine-type recombinase/integrase [uncultured Desulfovibrio sp.]